MVSHQPIVKGNAIHQIDVQHLPKEIYILSLQSNFKKYTARFVKEKTMYDVFYYLLSLQFCFIIFSLLEFIFKMNGHAYYFYTFPFTIFNKLKSI